MLGSLTSWLALECLISKRDTQQYLPCLAYVLASFKPSSKDGVCDWVVLLDRSMQSAGLGLTRPKVDVHGSGSGCTRTLRRTLEKIQ